MTDNPKRTDYVDNSVLYADLCNWFERKTAAIERGDQPPKLPDSVGVAILRMTEGMAQRGNFRQYTWLEEMVGDGICDAVKALNKFDPARVSLKTGVPNPFGFINLIVWRAFIGRIKNEKKKLDVVRAMMTDPNLEAYHSDDDSIYPIDNSDLNEFFYRGQ